MLALISDVHSNIEALTAVLNDIRKRGIARIVCLGDVVGYGPDPGACLDLVMDNCSDVIMGNHDWAVVYEPSRFNLGAESAVYWTRKSLEAEPSDECRARRWEFLGSREVTARLDGEDLGVDKVLLAHGSPRRPINEYVFPDDMTHTPGRIHAAMERIEHLCFVGHTHVPGVFTESMKFLNPEDIHYEYEVGQDKALINVGSVGQPRDRDPRACYTVLDEGRVVFCRVNYNVEAVTTKIFETPELDDYLGTRLQEGR
jgi:predicted phosphodiesterase